MTSQTTIDRFVEIICSAVNKLTGTLDVLVSENSHKGQATLNFRTSNAYESGIKQGMLTLMYDLQEILEISSDDMVKIIQRLNNTSKYPGVIYEPTRFGSRNRNKLKFINYQRNPLRDEEELDGDEDPFLLDNLSIEDYNKFYVTRMGKIFNPDNNVFYLHFRHRLPKNTIHNRQDIVGYEALQNASRLAIITAIILENIRQGLEKMTSRHAGYMNRIFTTPIVLLYSIYNTFAGNTGVNFYDNIHLLGL
uniref:Uncharacterized protein n=1 Tax=Dikerogammarus haemobaphes virus 1 TaxID=2704946 RepID=A0A6G9HDE4_9VIRU|nr:hypothetical protein [Dikerogammarus haemobaphes virus 1]